MTYFHNRKTDVSASTFNIEAMLRLHSLLYFFATVAFFVCLYLTDLFYLLCGFCYLPITLSAIWRTRFWVFYFSPSAIW